VRSAPEAEALKEDTSQKGSLEESRHKSVEADSDASDIDDEYASREKVENRLASTLPAEYDTTTAATVAVSTDSDNNANVKKPLGKAKAKRAKKAARQEMETEAGQQFKCVTCQNAFPSKTKLFDHIKELKHAQPVPKPAKGKSKR